MNLTERILAKNLKRETMTIPEWDNAIVVVRQANMKEFVELTDKSKSHEGSDTEKGMLWVVTVLEDEQGNKLLDDSQIPTLIENNPVSVLNRIAERVYVLNGVLQDKNSKN